MGPHPPPTQPRPTDDDRRWGKHRQVDHRVTDRIQTTTNHGMTQLIKKLEYFQKIHFFSQPPPRSQKITNFHHNLSPLRHTTRSSNFSIIFSSLTIPYHPHASHATDHSDHSNNSNTTRTTH